MSVFDELASDEIASADVSFPVLAPSVYEFTVKDVVKSETNPSEKSPDGGDMLRISLSLTANAEGVDGRTVPAGSLVSHMIWSPKNPNEEKLAQVKGQIKQFLLAVVGKDCEWDPTFALYRGQTLTAKTKVSKARVNPQTGEEYAPQAEVAKFVNKD
ncbi:MAG: hypothetical protein ACXABY_13620 [Candidatus Thorarchaeota archaeon]|jgi:hypothetical protein